MAHEDCPCYIICWSCIMILRSRASQALPACQSLACKAQRTGQERLLQLRQAASRRSTLTGARCTTMLALWLSAGLHCADGFHASLRGICSLFLCFLCADAPMQDLGPQESRQESAVWAVCDEDPSAGHRGFHDLQQQPAAGLSQWRRAWP